MEMSRTNRIFEACVAARDLSGLDDVYTSDARILPPGGDMITGRPAILQFWQGAIEALNVSSVELETVDCEQSGDTIWEIGRATLHVAQAPAAHAKYVVIWKREAGAWKWHVDIWNPNV
jgi:ketosteroid isomerase-like protein